jgi:hypothetical protein
VTDRDAGDSSNIHPSEFDTIMHTGSGAGDDHQFVDASLQVLDTIRVPVDASRVPNTGSQTGREQEG